MVAAFVIVVAASCLPAAALDQAQRCFHDKMRASRVVAANYLSCGLRHGQGDPQRGKCEARLTRRITRLLDAAEARASQDGFLCPADGEQLGLVGPSIWPFRLVTEVVNADAGVCAAPPTGAVRRYASSYAHCVEDVWMQGHGDAAECASETLVDLRRRWDAIPGASPCPDEVVDRLVTRVQSEVEETAERLEVRCGDRLLGGFEECDDGGVVDNDGCSADCREEDCRRVGDDVLCVVCPPGAVPTADATACRCPDGFEGEPESCVDLDECAQLDDACPDGRSCVNLAGTWACAIECTAEAFHAAIADCGAPSNAIAFDCSDTVIRIPAGLAGRPRDVHCDGLVIDGSGRNITFELDPLCWQTPVEPSQCPDGLESDGTCFCPDVDSGDAFVALRGNGNVVRDLTVRGFFDGIPVRGRNNLVQRVRFDRLCDDAFGSVSGGVGNLFRDLVVSRGCDKCSQNDGALEITDPDPRVREHYHAILSDVEFDSCRTPVRVASTARLQMTRVHAFVSDTEFPCDGPRFSSGSDALRVVLRVTQSRFEGCRRGIRLARGVEAAISQSVVTGSGLRGLRASSTARVSVEGSTIAGNGGGRSSETGYGGVAVLGAAQVDLGGGQLMIDDAAVQSAGTNSLCDNRGPDLKLRNLDSEGAGPVPAVSNWWCSANATPVGVLGFATTEPALRRAPLPLQ